MVKHCGEQISSKRNDLRVVQRRQSAAFTLIKMSEPLALLSSGTGQANICPAGRKDGRIRDATGVVERRGPSVSIRSGRGRRRRPGARLAMTDGPSDRKRRLREIIFTVEPWHC